MTRQLRDLPLYLLRGVDWPVRAFYSDQGRTWEEVYPYEKVGLQMVIIAGRARCSIRCAH